ncbi:nucleoside hydrolase [Actinomadura macra]|uniref:nucleoside hydrolase n=1 Tax=Actinomadura macra TaxID=46164 RepID=UPI000A03BAC9|nr:nucleoside hydrolase [Actinomadura macra]
MKIPTPALTVSAVLVAALTAMSSTAAAAPSQRPAAVPAQRPAAPVQAPASAHGPQGKVIIDTDMGQLNDDAAAMFMLRNADPRSVLGVTIVAGNTWAEEGTAYALRQLELIGERRIPVVVGAGEPLNAARAATLPAEEKLFGNVEYMGAFSRKRPESYLKLGSAPYGGYPKSRPSREAAADFIVDQVKKNPGQVTLFVLGPATNVALAVKTHPEIVPLVKEVIYMGGAIDIPGNTSPAAEFNWWFDPEAIKMTLRTPFKKQTVVPNDIAERVFYTKKEYDRIVAGPETPLKKMYKDLHGPRFERNPQSSSFVWDALTAGIYLRPDIATKVEERFIDVDDTYGPDYGRAIGYGESRRRSFSDPGNFPAGTQKVRILFDVNRDAFWNLYIDLMRR